MRARSHQHAPTVPPIPPAPAAPPATDPRHVGQRGRPGRCRFRRGGSGTGDRGPVPAAVGRIHRRIQCARARCRAALPQLSVRLSTGTVERVPEAAWVEHDREVVQIRPSRTYHLVMVIARVAAALAALALTTGCTSSAEPIRDERFPRRRVAGRAEPCRGVQPDRRCGCRPARAKFRYHAGARRLSGTFLSYRDRSPMVGEDVGDDRMTGMGSASRAVRLVKSAGECLCAGLAGVALIAACSSSAGTTPTSSAPSPSLPSPPASSQYSGPPKPVQPTIPADVPTVGPNMKRGEKPPLMPLEATQHTPDGAKAFAEFFIKTIDWGYATLTGRISATTDVRCHSAQHSQTAWTKVIGCRHRYVGGRITVTCTVSCADAVMRVVPRKPFA